jgi:PTS system fructose-specific IIC component
MQIKDLLNEDNVILSAAPKSKSEAIDILVKSLSESGKISDEEKFKKAVLEREAVAPTAVGFKTAVPHAKSDSVSSPSVAAMLLSDEIEFDDQSTKLVFLIASPSEGDAHLETLSELMKILMNEDLINLLFNAKSANEFINLISGGECEVSPSLAAKYSVLAVTACPTGIAHTYMAEKALLDAGERLSVSVKVETNGAIGVKNELTKDEISNCDGIIVAADKNVDLSRFDGKKVIRTTVSDGIKNPEKLINMIVSGNAETYKRNSSRHGSIIKGREIYKHIMSGVSAMLPFTVAGGIFIAIAFFIDSLAGAPRTTDFGSYTPIAAFFKTVGDSAFNLMIPVLAAFIAKSIADSPGFMVGLCGGYLALIGATFENIEGNGSSGFFGGILAGFAAGAIMLLMKKLLSKMPESLSGIKSVLIYPIGGLLAISLILFAVNPFMEFLNTSLSDFLWTLNDGSKIVLGFVLAAMMSTDMGGPFNKAAYVFGTAATTTGNLDVMAAVMLGGMVPPIAIALSTFMFKSRWSESERKNAPAALIMGISFVTEGAIPYVAADPLRVLPACIIGSGIAGGMSMAFDCGLLAPHGGIFVFPLVMNWQFYILSLVTGSVIGALTLALLKKKTH